MRSRIGTCKNGHRIKTAVHQPLMGVLGTWWWDWAWPGHLDICLCLTVLLLWQKLPGCQILSRFASDHQQGSVSYSFMFCLSTPFYPALHKCSLTSATSTLYCPVMRRRVRIKLSPKLFTASFKFSHSFPVRNCTTCRYRMMKTVV